MPFTCVGRKLDAYVYEHTVQLYDGVTLLVTHPRARRPGERHTKLEHYPSEKSFYLVHTREYCQAQAERIGPRCTLVVELLLEERPLDRLRSVQGLLGLARRSRHALGSRLRPRPPLWRCELPPPETHSGGGP